ncbi:MAG: 50S ribosomal protein L15 [Bacteroidota bacterium]|nr:50S ribosomal protein L15 [Bacteroidota bacterium]MDX5448771.1 50S ribosomal protein L15 [Bacteroidota bacterium]MDX5505717.1 50S ribosomal protein L15 [Bacteroidota bacterium]
MDLSNLKPASGSVHNTKRVGRGIGSGKGRTSTRGHKGAKSRSGYSTKIGFEGGQMPLQRRVPKFGFKNINRVEYKAINLSLIQQLVDDKRFGDTITVEDMINNGLIGKNEKVKVLGNGELKAKVSITAHKFSKTAQEAIEKLGGSVTTL